MKAQGYQPGDYYDTNAELRQVIDLVKDGFFSRGNSEQFRDLVGNLMHDDPYMVLADYRAYAECQRQVDATFRDYERWTRMSILNTARLGKFSSDRTIREYCVEIWHARGVPVQLITQSEAHAGLTP